MVEGGARSYEALSAKMHGIENMIEQMVSQVTSNWRKELRAAEDRLRRQIDSDRKDEATELHKVKATLTQQILDDVKAAEERIYRRMESERHKQKEQIAELRRETSSQIAAQQDTASFTTQRVVPKETEEMAALRIAMEDIRSLADNSRKDVLRLSQDVADQRRVCDGIQISIQNLPKHNEEMLALKLAVEKAENVAQQAKKSAEHGIKLNPQCQKELADLVGQMDAEIRADTHRQIGQTHSDIMIEMNKRLEDGKTVEQADVRRQMAQTRSDIIYEMTKRLEETKSSGAEMRTDMHRQMQQTRTDLVVEMNKLLEAALTNQRTHFPEPVQEVEAKAQTSALVDFGKGKKLEEGSLSDMLPHIEQMMKRWRAGFADQNAREPERYSEQDHGAEMDGMGQSMYAQAADPDYGEMENFEGEQAYAYENDGYDPVYEDQQGYIDVPQVPYQGVGYGAPVMNGGPAMMNGAPAMMNGAPAMINGAPAMMNGAPAMMNAGAPVVHSVTARPHGCFSNGGVAAFCGSIALPISREPEYYSEQDHAASEMGGMGQSMYAQAAGPEYGAMGSLDGETYACDNGGGYEAVYEQGYIDVPQVPYTSVSYGPPTVVGIGPPVVHSVTTRVGRPMSPVREQSPIRGRGASPVRGASPIRGVSAAAPMNSMTPSNPRHRELSPLRARSVGDPPSFNFQPGLVGNMSPLVNVATGATGSGSKIPPATIKEDAPKEDEDSSSDEEEEKPSTGTSMFGRLFQHGSA